MCFAYTIKYSTHISFHIDTLVAYQSHNSHQVCVVKFS